MALAALVALPVFAGTPWDGPSITYNQPSPDPTLAANQDRITPAVWLTRAGSGGLFNAATESEATNASPVGTEWAFGALTNYSALTYTNWLAWLNGKSPTTMVGSNIVVHLVAQDAYLSFKFSFWASKGAGGFTYQRSTPPQPVMFAIATNGPGGAFNFNYTAIPGATYVLQASTNLQTWLPLSTNLAGGTLMSGGGNSVIATPGFFRVEQVTNL